MPFHAPKVIRALKRFFTEKNAIAGVSDAFSVVTVINSFMMVTGLDTPKEGRFAYVHLLIRLGILTGVWVVFDFSYTIASTKTFFQHLRAGSVGTFATTCMTRLQ